MARRCGAKRGSGRRAFDAVGLGADVGGRWVSGVTYATLSSADQWTLSTCPGSPRSSMRRATAVIVGSGAFREKLLYLFSDLAFQKTSDLAEAVHCTGALYSVWEDL